MKQLILGLVLLGSFSSLTAMEDDSCLNRGDQVSIELKGQGLASMITYDLSLAFEPNSLSITYYSNRGIDVEINYDAEELSRTKVQLYPYESTDIQTAYQDPTLFNTMVRNGILEQLGVAERNMITKSEQNKEAIVCAKKRTMAIMKKVRNELLLKRNLID